MLLQGITWPQGVTLRGVSSQGEILACSSLQGRELSGQWVVHYLRVEMTDLQSYLHSCRMAGTKFHTALGYCISIYPLKQVGCSHPSSHGWLQHKSGAAEEAGCHTVTLHCCTLRVHTQYLGACLALMGLQAQALSGASAPCAAAVPSAPSPCWCNWSSRRPLFSSLRH